MDRHAASARSVARLPAEQRRWARVALDVYYDHLLARDWARYSSLPLARFAAGVYSALERHRPALPPDLARFAGFMVERDLLVQALNRTGWNVTRAAQLLGISRDTLRYRMEKYQVKPSS